MPPEWQCLRLLPCVCIGGQLGGCPCLHCKRSNHRRIQLTFRLPAALPAACCPLACPAAQTYLAKEPLDDLVSMLTKGRVVNRLLDFMPPSKRSQEDFAAHFT